MTASSKLGLQQQRKFSSLILRLFIFKIRNLADNVLLGTSYTSLFSAAIEQGSCSSCRTTYTKLKHCGETLCRGHNMHHVAYTDDIVCVDNIMYSQPNCFKPRHTLDIVTMDKPSSPFVSETFAGSFCYWILSHSLHCFNAFH